MPKNECDPEDPLELVGVELSADENQLHDMALCFAEEFARDGWPRAQILAMFKNPFYAGPHLAWKQKGDAFVENVIEQAIQFWRVGQGHSQFPLLTKEGLGEVNPSVAAFGDDTSPS